MGFNRRMTLKLGVPVGYLHTCTKFHISMINVRRFFDFVTFPFHQNSVKGFKEF